uniref:Copper homeostasis protein cutC homolog n=1 Tax=Bionectria ochroleuca TaxID=29856 RepID=A0A8H7NGR0_BIOOC
MSLLERNIKLEVAVFSAGCALKAQLLGAQRVELSAPGSYRRGGLTPPLAEVLAVKGELKIPLRIMIRPVSIPDARHPGRKDDFVYTDDEFTRMLYDIIEFKNCGAMDLMRGDGFVFGILKERDEKPEVGGDDDDDDDGVAPAKGARLEVDKERCSILVETARPYPCVFHRAFDPIAQTDEYWKQGLDDLLECKFDSLLTSGGPESHTDSQKLRSMIDHALPDLEITVGGGVRSTNTAQLITDLGAHCTKDIWLHSSCLVPKGPFEAQKEAVDPDLLRDLLVVINQLRQK